MKMDEIIPHNVDRLLSELGLQRRESAGHYIIPALGVFAAGAVVGGLLGLLLAPSSGRELRGQIEKKLRDVRDAEPNGNGESRRPANA